MVRTLRKGDKAKEKPRKQQQRDCAECAALRAQVEEANALTEELRGDLKSERETVRFVVVVLCVQWLGGTLKSKPRVCVCVFPL